mgnify:CR=1 FL=1
MPIKASDLEIGDYVPGEFVILDIVRGEHAISAFIETTTGARFYRTWAPGDMTKCIR